MSNYTEELVEALRRVQGNVSMIDASPADSLNATLKRRALNHISAALEQAEEIDDCIPIEEAEEASRL